MVFPTKLTPLLSKVNLNRIIKKKTSKKFPFIRHCDCLTTAGIMWSGHVSFWFDHRGHGWRIAKTPEWQVEGWRSITWPACR